MFNFRTVLIREAISIVWLSFENTTWNNCLCSSLLQLLVVVRLLLWDAYMTVVSVPCVRPPFGQADYHMTTLPLLGHDGKEELYWARVSFMPSEGHMFSV